MNDVSYNLMAMVAKSGVRRLFTEGLFGLEKESLRVTEDGKLAMTSHPEILGDSFTDPHITTDFSESQLEFITLPFESIDSAVANLKRLHHFVANRLENEYIWPFSMPCRLPKDKDIPIARYGDSSEAKFKEKYREGLASRYGKAVQMICGVHFNVSFNPKIWSLLHKESHSDLTEDEFKNEEYLGVVRNFILHRWLLVYLFAASPSFDADGYSCSNMPKGKRQAISMRLSRCGYSNPAKIPISYNHFRTHLKDIRSVISTSFPAYEKFGNNQLNSNLLQIPNENYFLIRLKPTVGQDILEGLETGGVRYLEIRLFDLNPMNPYGVDVDALYFVHLFLLFCLFEPNSKLDEAKIGEMNDLQADLAFTGRQLKPELQNEGAALFKKMRPLAELLGGKYLEVFGYYEKSFLTCEGLLWQQVLHAMGDDGFLEFGVKTMKKYHDYLTK